MGLFGTSVNKHDGSTHGFEHKDRSDLAADFPEETNPKATSTSNYGSGNTSSQYESQTGSNSSYDQSFADGNLQSSATSGSGANASGDSYGERTGAPPANQGSGFGQTGQYASDNVTDSSSYGNQSGGQFATDSLDSDPSFNNQSSQSGGQFGSTQTSGLGNQTGEYASDSSAFGNAGNQSSAGQYGSERSGLHSGTQTGGDSYDEGFADGNLQSSEVTGSGLSGAGQSYDNQTSRDFSSAGQTSDYSSAGQSTGGNYSSGTTYGDPDNTGRGPMTAQVGTYDPTVDNSSSNY